MNKEIDISKSLKNKNLVIKTKAGPKRVQSKVARKAISRDSVEGLDNERAFLAAVLEPDNYENIRYPSTFMSGTATLKCVHTVLPAPLVTSGTYYSGTVFHPNTYHGIYRAATAGTSTSVANIENAVFAPDDLEGYSFLYNNAGAYRVIGMAVEVRSTSNIDTAEGMLYIGIMPTYNGKELNDEYLNGSTVEDEDTSLSIPMNEFVQSDGIIVTSFPAGFESTGALMQVGYPTGTRFTMRIPQSTSILDNSVFVATNGTTAQANAITMKYFILYEYLPINYQQSIALGVAIGDVERALPIIASGLSRAKHTNLTRTFTRVLKTVTGLGKDIVSTMVHDVTMGIVPKSMVRKGLDFLGSLVGLGHGLQQTIVHGFRSPYHNPAMAEIYQFCSLIGIPHPEKIDCTPKEFIDRVLAERENNGYEVLPPNAAEKPRTRASLLR